MRRQWIRLSIGGKLFIGYGILAGLVLVVSLVSMAGLQQINKTNNSILQVDVPIGEAADRMIDAVLDQENYARRSRILKSRELTDLFEERGRDFRKYLEMIENLPHVELEIDVEHLRAVHVQYSDAITFSFAEGEEGAAEDSPVVRTHQQDLIARLQGLSASASENQQRKTAQIAEFGLRVFYTIFAICIASALLSVTSVVLLNRSIARPLNRLKAATERISEGQYDEVPRITSMDEVGDLYSAFGEMTRRLKRLEEMYLDAQPLTRLPGSIAIENTLGKRLATGEPIAFCFVDLDNFKAYNDRYGYARGSEVIKKTARILEDVVRDSGETEDFVGHVGGDDFVVITVPDRFQTICSEVIREFDAAIPGYYDEGDRKSGHIDGKTRQGEKRQFPIISVSIAVVTNRERSLDNPIQVGEMAADLKEYAKSLEGSLYVVDRRRREGDSSSDKVVSFPSSS